MKSRARAAGKQHRFWEKQVRKRYGKAMSPGLIDELVSIRRRRAEKVERQQAAEAEKDRLLADVAQDQAVSDLLRGIPELWELRVHFTVLSKDPIILHWSELEDPEEGPENLPPPSSTERQRASVEAMTDTAKDWQKLCLLVTKAHARPLPAVKITWCAKLGRCVCGPYEYFLSCHSRLRAVWNLHIKKPENDSGRLVFEVSGPEPGDRSSLYHVSAKIGDLVALWELGIRTDVQRGEEEADPS